MSEAKRPGESVVEIDENNLDREWTRQPSLYFRWARRAADARFKMDEAKAAVDVTRAEVDSEVRAEPEKFGIDGKVTEKMVEAAVMQHVRTVRVVKQLAQAKYEYEVLSALVGALDQRKSALENLVRLHLSSYYAEPRAPEGKREEVEEMQKDAAFRPRRRRGDD